MRHLAPMALLAAASAGVGACAPGPEVTQAAPRAEYLGIRTVLLEDDMASFRVAMKGARDAADLEAYGRCAAAQYALIRGAGFARHVRTNVARTREIWRADAVYVISAALPRGLQTIDAEVTVRDCGERGIPTV